MEDSASFLSNSIVVDSHLIAPWSPGLPENQPGLGKPGSHEPGYG